MGAFIGGLLAFLPKIDRKVKYRSILTGSGIFLIFMSFYFLNKDLSFPGVNALYPCLGAGLVILANHKEKQNPVSHFLSIKPLVFIGLISYSLYLWHWSFIVFYKHYTFEKPDLIFVFAFSFVVATLSWRFIESPFRLTNKKGLPYLILLLTAISLILFGCYVYLAKGIPQRLPKKLSYISISGLKELKNPQQKKCFTDWGKGISINQVWEKSCRLGISNNDKKEVFAFIGDSHSDALFTAQVSEFKTTLKNTL